MAAFSGFFGILAALLASIISYGRWPTPLLAGHVKFRPPDLGEIKMTRV
jgi:hypothetical protein